MRRAGWFASSWSVGNHHIGPGKRLFLMRLRVKPRGIIGSGRATSHTHSDTHWNPDCAAQGKTATYAEMVFDSLYQEAPLPVSGLQMPPLNEFDWGIQMSGVTIPDPIAEKLEDAWAAATGNAGIGFPGERPGQMRSPRGLRPWST